MEENRVLLKNTRDEKNRTLAGYLKNGGFEGAKEALKTMEPSDVISIVKKSSLRGRGGAGFPSGMKWELCASDKAFPKYLICNADEGEPGTFKDRELLENDPFAVIEGMLVSAYAIGATKGYIYLRGEYRTAGERLESAMKEARKSGYLGDNILGSDFSFDVLLYMGAGSYICGEETALLESLEGKEGNSRIKPPFPVNVGLWGKPTVVNNVETLCSVPKIVINGDDWYRALGSGEECDGTKIYSLSGHVNKPGNYELPMGSTLRELIYDIGGGIRGGKKLKAVFPGGPSSSCLTPDDLDTKMDFKSLALAGSMLGSGAVVVMDEDTCMVEVAINTVSFYAEESCGKCTPCREGNLWIKRLLERVRIGDASEEELSLIVDLGENMAGSCFCALGMGAPSAVLSLISKFRDDFVKHMQIKGCPKKVIAR